MTDTNTLAPIDVWKLQCWIWQLQSPVQVLALLQSFDAHRVGLDVQDAFTQAVQAVVPRSHSGSPVQISYQRLGLQPLCSLAALLQTLLLGIRPFS